MSLYMWYMRCSKYLLRLLNNPLSNCFSNCGLKIKFNHIGGVMVSVLALSALDCGFELRSGHTKYYKIGICCFSAKYAALRSKSKDWLARNQNNVSEWSDMSTHVLLFQWANTDYTNPTQHVGLEQSGPHHHLIEN
jgi:hypothetical protein